MYLFVYKKVFNIIKIFFNIVNGFKSRILAAEGFKIKITTQRFFLNMALKLKSSML